MAIAPDRLGDVDIARVNLLCASSLPSTQNLDINHALDTLDTWAARVATETNRYLHRVTDPRTADHYGRSEAQYRAEMLAQVLQEDLGVHYNREAVGDFSFADVTTGFIHGMIPDPGQTTADTPGGTCVSMPVIYVAVGRRLGYPLTLSTTDSHVFARWDGLGHENPAWRERFNCETTGGFNRFDDDYYRSWPHSVAEHEVVANGYLESLTSVEELAFFMATRGHHAVDVGQARFAARCYENAYRYDSSRPSYQSWFLDAALASDYRPVTPELERRLAARRVPDFLAAASSRSPSRPVQSVPVLQSRIGNRFLPPKPFVTDPVFQQPPDPTTFYDQTEFDFR